MITVEDLLMAYASAYDAWLDPETERENPIPEYAELIRRVVSAENANLREEIEAAKHDLSLFSSELVVSKAENTKLRELVRDMFGVISRNNTWWDGNAKDTSRLSDRMRELGIEAE